MFGSAKKADPQYPRLAVGKPNASTGQTQYLRLGWSPRYLRFIGAVFENSPHNCAKTPVEQGSWLVLVAGC
jgi:hypothetical protein